MSTKNAEFGWPGGDQPGTLDFQYRPSSRASAAIRESLRNHFPDAATAGVVFEALAPPDGPIGRYKVVTNHGSWFLRVTSRSKRSDLEQALVGYLANQHVAVNPALLVDAPIEWNGALLKLDVLPLIEGSHYSQNLDQLRSVAAAVSACHQTLMRFERRSEIQLASVDRYLNLERIRERLADCLRRNSLAELFYERVDWASKHSEWLQDLVDHVYLRWDLLADAQCIHGELHQGNILFERYNNQAILIDFEEATHLFAPPVWDLAFMVQRFCMADNPSSSVLSKRLAVVANGYGRPLPPLAGTMRQIAWFTFLMLIGLRVDHNVLSPVSEYDKFVNLERQAFGYLGDL